MFIFIFYGKKKKIIVEINFFLLFVLICIDSCICSRVVGIFGLIVLMYIVFKWDVFFYGFLRKRRVGLYR